MRTPTDPDAAYEYWRRRLAGLRPAVDLNSPQIGWYKRRMVAGGVFVPVEIRIIQVIDQETGELFEDERLQAIVDGEISRDLQKTWEYCCTHAISREEYDFMCRDAEWCRQHARWIRKSVRWPPSISIRWIRYSDD